MLPFEILDHTSEAKFRAHGRTLEEAFANAVRAVTAIATDQNVEEREERKIEITGEDLESLLFNLIDELIFLIDTQDFIPASADVKIERNGTCALRAVLKGGDVREYGSNLKAPTYSDMLVREEDGRWMLQAVVDV